MQSIKIRKIIRNEFVLGNLIVWTNILIFSELNIWITNKYIYKIQLSIDIDLYLQQTSIVIINNILDKYTDGYIGHM